jgi:pimeloyl-ACP methyl ester carboxylesterase
MPFTKPGSRLGGRIGSARVNFPIHDIAGAGGPLTKGFSKFQHSSCSHVQLSPPFSLSTRDGRRKKHCHNFIRTTLNSTKVMRIMTGRSSYRHRYGNAPGDPALEAIELRPEAQPTIAVPTIVLNGAADGVVPPQNSEDHARYFTSRYERRIIPVA